MGGALRGFEGWRGRGGGGQMEGWWSVFQLGGKPRFKQSWVAADVVGGGVMKFE